MSLFTDIKTYFSMSKGRAFDIMSFNYEILNTNCGHNFKKSVRHTKE